MESIGAIIGIDRGASFTDFAVVENNALVSTHSLPDRGWRPILDVYRQLARDHKCAHSVFTGAAGGMPDELSDRVETVAEIDAIGFGGAGLAGRSDCVVTCIGTGTAIVHFKDCQTVHVGGTGVGGGTVKGLASLLCDTEDPKEIDQLALGGKASAMNLTISDLGYETVSFLGADMTASNFAAVNSRRKEDLAAGILSLVGETVGIIASLCAREAGCSRAIVAVGKVAGSPFIRNTLELVGKLYQTEFIFPENPGVATVFGAARSYACAKEAQ
jgi:type II pantothenate kinase